MADKVTVKLEGVEKAISELKWYQVIKKQAIKDIIKEVALKVEASTKRDGNVPVQYGRLKASISTGISGQPGSGDKDKVNPPSGPPGLVAAVGTNVKYAHIQEFGSWGDATKPGKGEYPSKKGRKHKPRTRPKEGFLFLTKAYYKHEPEVLRRMAKVMKKKT